MEKKKVFSLKFLFVTIIPLLSFIAVVVGSTYAFYMITIDVTGNEKTEEMLFESARVVAMFEATNEIDDENIRPGYSNELHFTIVNTSDKENLFGRYTLSWEIRKYDNEIDDENFVYTLTGKSYIKDESNIINQDERNKLINVSVPMRIPDATTSIGYGIINTGVTHDYTLKIELRDNGKNQNDLQGKSFSGKIVAKGI